ncbi:hypothetical protein [Agromyces sp. Marseille-Q5079]|uniref:hypothetical protein n=1 Tax=Agromyces sp. Marseille-Q5079 TaxID=3439059 RepID=UPI003D9CABA7
MTSTQNPDVVAPTAATATTPAASVRPAAPVAPAASVAPPSIHVRALLTWLAIFPLVTIGLTLIAPFAEAWPPVVRALVLTLVVVPTAVYLVMPFLLKVRGGLHGRRAARRG